MREKRVFFPGIYEHIKAKKISDLNYEYKYWKIIFNTNYNFLLQTVSLIKTNRLFIVCF